MATPFDLNSNCNCNLCFNAVFSAASDFTSGTGTNSSFNYSCSLSPNSHSSSSSEVQVSSPSYHVSTTSSPPVVCSLLGQAPALGLGSPILPVLASCPSNKTSLPFKLRHKAGNNTSHGPNSGSVSNGNSTGGDHRSIHDSDASDSSDGTSILRGTVPPLSSSVESNGAFGDATVRENTCSPDSMLKTENFALKSELQRLASEVATLKNVLVYSSQSMGGMPRLKMSNDRCHMYQPVSPAGNHSPVHYSEDLVDSKVLLSNVIQFQKMNDIIV